MDSVRRSPRKTQRNPGDLKGSHGSPRKKTLVNGLTVHKSPNYSSNVEEDGNAAKTAKTPPRKKMKNVKTRVESVARTRARSRIENRIEQLVSSRTTGRKKKADESKMELRKESVKDTPIVQQPHSVSATSNIKAIHSATTLESSSPDGPVRRSTRASRPSRKLLESISTVGNLSPVKPVPKTSPIILNQQNHTNLPSEASVEKKTKLRGRTKTQLLPETSPIISSQIPTVQVSVEPKKRLATKTTKKRKTKNDLSGQLDVYEYSSQDGEALEAIIPASAPVKVNVGNVGSPPKMKWLKTAKIETEIDDDCDVIANQFFASSQCDTPCKTSRSRSQNVEENKFMRWMDWFSQEDDQSSISLGNIDDSQSVELNTTSISIITPRSQRLKNHSILDVIELDFPVMPSQDIIEIHAAMINPSSQSQSSFAVPPMISSSASVQTFSSTPAPLSPQTSATIVEDFISVSEDLNPVSPGSHLARASVVSRNSVDSWHSAAEDVVRCTDVCSPARTLSPRVSRSKSASSKKSVTDVGFAPSTSGSSGLAEVVSSGKNIMDLAPSPSVTSLDATSSALNSDVNINVDNPVTSPPVERLETDNVVPVPIAASLLGENIITDVDVLQEASVGVQTIGLSVPPYYLEPDLPAPIIGILKCNITTGQFRVKLANNDVVEVDRIKMDQNNHYRRLVISFYEKSLLVGLERISLASQSQQRPSSPVLSPPSSSVVLPEPS